MNRARNFVPLLLLALAAWNCPAQDKQDKKEAKTLRDESRVWIVRNLQSEAATLKKALPRGKDGLPMDAEKGVDEKELLQRVTDNGVALHPGDLVQITKIEFKKNEIIFEINGGGKGNHHWYQNVQVMGPVGGGPVMADPNAGPVVGSSIELRFRSAVPDLTSDDLRQMLLPVLDFSRRSAAVVYTESLPPETQEAIKSHKVSEGMDKDMVLASRGRPDRKIRETKRGVETEDWVWGTPPSKVTIVTFENDKVVKVKELTPGVADPGVPVAEGADKQLDGPKQKGIPITSPRPDKP